MSLPMWGMPGMPMPAPPPSNPHTAAVLNSCYEAAMAGQDLPPLRRKKLSSLLMNRGGDTPILRTVLGQGQADSSQPMPLVCHPDSHERNHTNGSPRDTDKVTFITIPQTAHITRVFNQKSLKMCYFLSLDVDFTNIVEKTPNKITAFLKTTRIIDNFII